MEGFYVFLRVFTSEKKNNLAFSDKMFSKLLPSGDCKMLSDPSNHADYTIGCPTGY
jgi:hypothetical protein